MRETTTITLAVLLGATMLTSGCTSRVGGAGKAGEDSPSRTTSSTPTSTSAPSTAADGTDPTACADADCEILVTGATPIPLEPRFGCSSFVVTFVAPNRSEFQVERTELNPVNAYILGTGYVGLQRREDHRRPDRRVRCGVAVHARDDGPGERRQLGLGRGRVLRLTADSDVPRARHSRWPGVRASGARTILLCRLED